LRGEFAFALWDGRNNTLFAARDLFGIKPLYYARYRGTLHLASEIKSLLAAGVPSRWDHATFLQASHFLVTPEDRPLFDGILQVPPGHFLIASGGNIQLIRYWDFDYPAANQSLPAGIDQEYAEQFRHVLDQAVQLRLRADLPGRMLSQRRD
jgi:asparagine synthase (glutamine-hydrolysing)